MSIYTKIVTHITISVKIIAIFFFCILFSHIILTESNFCGPVESHQNAPSLKLDKCGFFVRHCVILPVKEK